MAWIHARFSVFALALAWPVVASVNGCTSADTAGAATDGGSQADANGTPDDDAGSVSPDAAVTTCSPASVQSYTPRWTPPKPHSSSCTSDQIASYAACLAANDTTSAACAAWFGADASANSDCHTCLADSNSTDPSWGPIIDNGSVRQINIPGCMALVSGDTGGTGCAGQYQALEGCESAACATNCTNAPSSLLDSCVSAADNGGCSNLLTGAACVNDAGAADECFGPQNATFTTIFTAVATEFCLSTGDAGTLDAGGGGNDGGDAGDGG